MKKDGSITIFASLALMLIASFIFALLEAGRFNGLSVRADMVTEIGIESVFAEYQPALWEDYALLGLDGAYGNTDFSIARVNNRLTGYLENNLNVSDKRNEIFAITVSDVSDVEYKLITDSDGSAFISYIAENWLSTLSQDIVSTSYEKYQKQDQIEKQEGEETSIEVADSAVESEKAAAEEADKTVQTENVENPLKVALEWKRNALLGMVVEDAASLSSSSIDTSDSLMLRSKTAGTASDGNTAGVAERILVIEYLDRYFSDYCDGATDRPLSYELEYVLCGADSDKANLEGVAQRLLLLREASNVIHIVGDSEKRALSESLAAAIAGFTLNAAIIKLVQTAIIAAWAYLESIQDVRTLLAGEKISLIKNRDEWTLDLNNLSSSFDRASKAKSCENGLTYTDYLKGFISLESNAALSYRMMDIMENRIRAVDGYENFRMDHVILSMKNKCTYSAVPLFSSLVTIGRLGISEYEFTATKEFAY